MSKSTFIASESLRAACGLPLPAPSSQAHVTWERANPHAPRGPAQTVSRKGLGGEDRQQLVAGRRAARSGGGASLSHVRFARAG